MSAAGDSGAMQRQAGVLSLVVSVSVAVGCWSSQRSSAPRARPPDCNVAEAYSETINDTVVDYIIEYIDGPYEARGTIDLRVSTLGEVSQAVFAARDGEDDAEVSLALESLERVPPPPSDYSACYGGDRHRMFVHFEIPIDCMQHPDAVAYSDAMAEQLMSDPVVQAFPPGLMSWVLHLDSEGRIVRARPMVGTVTRESVEAGLALVGQGPFGVVPKHLEPCFIDTRANFRLFNR